MELQQQLASVALLSDLDDRVRRRLADTGKRRTYSAEQTIVTQGSTGSAFYIVLSGHARVERDGQVIGQVGSGDFFGELALIEEHGRTASVIATEETECLLFAAWEFTALLEEHPELAVQIMKVLIGRQHRREHHND